MALPLRPHQVEAFAHYLKHKRTADISDPGCGKTAPACVYAAYLWEVNGIKTMWTMPKSLLAKNKKELLDFTDLKENQVVIVDGTPKERLEQISNPDGVVFLMGFKRLYDDWENFKKIQPKINAVFADEIHMGGLKRPDSKSTTSFFKCMSKMEYFLAMSGTLIDGRLDSCYATIKVIEPRYYYNHNSFMSQHALTDDYGKVVMWMGHDKLGRIFGRHCFRRTFKEVYGEEAKVMFKTEVELDSKSHKAYKEFEEKAILELDSAIAALLKNEIGVLEGTNEAVSALRCRQIMQHPHHFGILEEDELTGKEEAIQVHVEDCLNSNKPIIIFSCYQPEQERLVRLLTKWGMKVGLINGNVPTEKRAQIDRDFQSGKLNAIVGSPATAAVGFNWGHCDLVIFTSIDYQDVNFVQAYKRTIRGTRTTYVRIYVLGYRNSLDNKVFFIVDTKSRNRHMVDPTYEKLNLSGLR